MELQRSKPLLGSRAKPCPLLYFATTQPRKRRVLRSVFYKLTDMIIYSTNILLYLQFYEMQIPSYLCHILVIMSRNLYYVCLKCTIDIFSCLVYNFTCNQQRRCGYLPSASFCYSDNNFLEEDNYAKCT